MSVLTRNRAERNSPKSQKEWPLERLTSGWQKQGRQITVFHKLVFLKKNNYEYVLL